MKNLLTAIFTIGLAAACHANWTLIDDVDGYDNSSSTLLADGITYDAGVGHDVWVGIPSGTGMAHVYDDVIPGDQSLAVYGPGWRGAGTDLKNNFGNDFSLADGGTATYFFQFMTEGFSFDCMFGLSESTDSVDEVDAWRDYSVMPFIAGGQLQVYGDNGSGGAITSIQRGHWYNVWLVVDNGAKKFDLYWSTGSTNAVLGLSGIEFGRVTDPVNLEVFAFSQNLGSTVHIDNLYRAPGASTDFPSPDIELAPMPNRVGGALAGVTSDTIYLMCYHEGYYPAGGNSGVFVCWSTNGYDFAPLNDGHPVFVPPEFPGDDGDNSDGYQNLTRDPSMIYGSDGLFHLVFTSDINSRSFGYAESPDLVHWSNIKLVQIWQNESRSIDHTWAPEWFYNEDNGRYMVAFASGVGGASLRMWYTETVDFETFSDPRELYADPSGATVIDGSIARIDASHYVMVAGESGTLRALDSASPYGPWTARSGSPLPSGTAREGPCLIKMGDTWHLYFDRYGRGDDVFGLAISTDAATWTDVTGQTVMPKKSDVPDYGYDGGPPHHGTVFAVPHAALSAFDVPFSDNVTNLSSLAYRWSFDEPAGSISDETSVIDSVSGAVAVVRGNRANFTGTGLVLPGDTAGTGDAAYIDLPNGMVSSLTNLTVEIWAVPESSKNWQRLFSFGRTSDAGDGGGEWNGPATSGTSALNAMYWTINVGSDLNKQQCAMRDYADNAKDAVSGTGIDTTVGTAYHYVFTFEDGVGFFGDTGGRMTFYRDGYQIGWRDASFRLRDIEDVNNWLGRSQWSGDSNSNVEYDEVRIYSEALSWVDIFGHYLAGPDVPVNAAPRVEIAIDGAGITLTWPGNTVGRPQQNDVLGGTPGWSAVTYALHDTTNGLHVTLPVLTNMSFYRIGR